MKQTVINIISATAFLLETSAFAATNSEIAVQFFPPDMKTAIIAEYGESGTVDLSRFVNVVPADLDNSGSRNYLVCLYHDHANGILRVIKAGGTQPSLVADSTNVDIYGIEGAVQLVDLQNDKKPEIVVSFMSDRGNTSTWIFRWTSPGIQLVSPTTSMGTTALGGVNFMDLTGDGILAVVTKNDVRPPVDANGNPQVVPNITYTLGASGLVQKSVNLVQATFVRGKGAPQDSVRSFALGDTTKPYILKVVDLNMSKPDTGPLTSSATISLNGKQIIGPNDFNPGKRTKVISKPVQVQSSNKLTVKMAGAPGSKVLVTLSQSQ
jgi:hypothetical protein